MKELKPRIHDEKNGLDYVLVGDYYVPDIKLPEETRPIGKWGMMRRTYLKEARPILWTDLVITGKVFTHLADINEDATNRFHLLMRQMMKAEGVTEELKRIDQMEWIRSVNSIINRVEEMIKEELIYV